jgi:hypothetical protein
VTQQDSTPASPPPPAAPPLQGIPVYAAPAPMPQARPSGIDALIPYKNAPALVAYYTGVFSLIPCTALVLGTIAVVAGIIGLTHAAKHPEAKGKAHAWTGIILGSLSLLANVAAIAALAMGAIE